MNNKKNRKERGQGVLEFVVGVLIFVAVTGTAVGGTSAYYQTVPKDLSTALQGLNVGITQDLRDLDTKTRTALAINAAVTNAILLTVAPPSDHALARHDENAEAAVNCVNKYGQWWNLGVNLQTNRRFIGCIQGPSIYFVIESMKDGSNVTAGIKEKFKTLKQLVQYAINSGYEPSWFVRLLVGLP